MYIHNPYDVLGLSMDADAKTLKRRFRELLRKVHPDLNPNDPSAHAKTQSLVEAYELLSDSGRRAALNERLREKESTPSRKPPQAKSPKPKHTEASRKSSKKKKRNRSTFEQKNNVVINGQSINSQGTQSINIFMNHSQVRVHTFSSDTSSRAAITAGSGFLNQAVLGDVQVSPGAHLEICGSILGNVFADDNCQVIISGTVMGHVYVRYSMLEVRGVVMGDIYGARDRVRIHGVHMGQLR